MDRPQRRLTRREMLRLATLGAGSAAAMRSLPARAFSGGPGPERLRLARAWARTPRQWAALAGFDDTHRVFDDGSIELLLWPGDLQRLDAAGIRFEVTVPDLVARDRALRDQAPVVATGVPGVRSDYRTLAEYESDLLQLADDYPGMARVFTLPLRSLEGRTVYGIEIAADLDRADGRPVFYMDGLHHAREWPSGELTIMFGYDLLTKYGSDSRVTALMDNVRTVLVPVVNPDGFSYSRDSLVQTRTYPHWYVLAVGGLEAYWRKNRRSVSGVTVPVAQRDPDSYGVDVNRNYGLQWGGPGADELPPGQTHHGAAAFSEPEAENVRRLLTSMQVTALNSNHTYSELILRPLGWTRNDAPDEALLKAVGDAMAATMPSNRRYRSIKGRDLYATTGTTMDWGYGALGALSYTFEHGQEFHPPYSHVPPMYELNREAFLLLAEAAANPAYHAVIRGRVVDGTGAGLAADLRVRKSFDMPLWPGNPSGQAAITQEVDTSTKACADGTFVLHVCPSRRPFESAASGHYELTASAPGHGSQTVQVTVGRGSVADLATLILG